MNWPLFWTIILQVLIGSVALRIALVPWTLLVRRNNRTVYTTSTEKIL